MKNVNIFKIVIYFQRGVGLWLTSENYSMYEKW